jgi:hypothetical protein
MIKAVQSRIYGLLGHLELTATSLPQSVDDGISVERATCQKRKEDHAEKVSQGRRLHLHMQVRYHPGTIDGETGKTDVGRGLALEPMRVIRSPYPCLSP